MVIFVTILQLISALILIAVVLFQSGKSQGLSGAIGGIADSYLSKSKAKSVDAKLAKATKWVGAVIVVLTLVLNCMVAAGLKAKILKRKADILWMSAFFLSKRHCLLDKRVFAASGPRTLRGFATSQRQHL